MLRTESSISFGELMLTQGALLRAIGYSDFQPGKDVKNKIDCLWKQSASRSDPSFSYRIYEGHPGQESLHIEKACFTTGRIILHALKGCTLFAVFTATAGNVFQLWMDELNNSKDMVDQYIADAIGSEIVEAAADCMQKRLAAECRKRGYGITNRYSPGYCGWPVHEQHALFSLLDKKHVGPVRLMDSGLMYPIKSVSGIIGIGKEAKRQEYGCTQCNYPNCFKRKR